MTIVDKIATELPQTVVGIEINDPIITIYGDGWHLTVWCPWAMTGPDVTSSWESSRMAEETRVLIGRSLIRVAGRADKSDSSVIDPTFHFEGDIEIAVSVDAGWEPWSMSLPNIKGIIGLQSPGR